MMEKRLLFGMAGVVLAVLFAFIAQVVADMRGCDDGLCAAAFQVVPDGGRS